MAPPSAPRPAPVSAAAHRCASVARCLALALACCEAGRRRAPGADLAGARAPAALLDTTAAASRRSGFPFQAPAALALATGAFLPSQGGYPAEGVWRRTRTLLPASPTSEEWPPEGRQDRWVRTPDMHSAFGPGVVHTDVWDRAGRERAKISLPAEWAHRFVKGSLRCVLFGPHSGSFFASLASDPRVQVHLQICTADDPALAQRISISRLLGPRYGVATCLASLVIGNEAFLLTEAAGDGELSMRMHELLEHRAPLPGRLWMPLRESLPLLVSMLRGMQSLEAKGVVHCGLTEDRVLLHEGHALISGLGHACQVSDALDCRCVREGSAFRQAPEMLEGRPTGPSNNVWQVGLIFWKMCTGEIPTEPAVLSRLPHAQRLLLDFDPKGRKQIREALSDFSVEADFHYAYLRELHQDVLDLASGLLDPDPRTRLSASGAIRLAEQVAQGRGVIVPGPRPPIQLPSGWREDWQ